MNSFLKFCSSVLKESNISSNSSLTDCIRISISSSMYFKFKSKQSLLLANKSVNKIYYTNDCVL